MNLGQLFRAIRDVFDKVGKIFNSIGSVLSIASKIFSTIISSVSSIIDRIKGVFDFIKELFNCFMALAKLIRETFIYVGNFTVWFFVDFMPWIGQYFECAINKIIDLPKCFFWYLFDCIIWFISFISRFTLWIIDSILIALFKISEDYTLERLIHDYFWCPLEDLDKFIHDDGPNNLGTGFHIIHFPDSVMDRCYHCNIKPIRRKIPSTKNLKQANCQLQNCRSGGAGCTTVCTKNKCEIEKKKKVDSYFEEK